MEETIIRMAAPTLAGIKTGSLFPYYYTSREELGKEMGRLNRLLIPRGLRLVLLRLTERSALLYLFRPSELEKDLLDSTACEILHRAGYPCSGCGACLRHLLKRFHCGEELSLSQLPTGGCQRFSDRPGQLQGNLSLESV